MSAPPLGPKFVPERACTRAIDADWNPCGKEPFIHVAWRDTPEGIEAGWVCEEHAHELDSKWKPLQAHAPGPDCGMPGSRWFLEENVCRCVDEDEAVPADASPVVVAAAGQADSR